MANDIKATIREAGGVVHSDGNIFFTNATQFLAAAERLDPQASSKGGEAVAREVHRAWAFLKDTRNEEAYAILSALVGWDHVKAMPLAAKPVSISKQRCLIGAKCDACTCAEDLVADSAMNAMVDQQSEGMSLAPGAAEIMGNALREGYRNTRNIPKGHS